MCLVCIPWTIACTGNRVSDFLELELPLVVNLLRVFGIEPGSSGVASAPKGLLLCFYVAEAGTVLSEDRKKTLYSELSLQLGGRIIPY